MRLFRRTAALALLLLVVRCASKGRNGGDASVHAEPALSRSIAEGALAIV